MAGFLAPLRLPPCSTRAPQKSLVIEPLRAFKGHSLGALWPLYERYIDQRNRSADNDRQRWARFIAPHLASLQPGDIRRADVMTVLEAMGGYAPATKRLVLALLRRFLNWLIEMELFSGPNPAAGVKLFVDNTRTRVLSDRERQVLLEGLERAEVRFRLIILALLWTGKRRGELRSLRWSDVELEKGLIRLRATNTKAKRVHTFPLNSKALEVFHEANRRRICDLVFPHPSGRPYAELNKHWARFRATIGLRDVWLHDLRRTWITGLARAGVSPAIIQRLSGHQTLAVVMRYCHLEPEDVRAAAEAIVS